MNVPRNRDPMRANPEPKYKMGDILHYRDGKVFGTIVVIEGNPPCRFYGVRSPTLIGIIMVRQFLLEDPKQYDVRVS